MPSTAFFATSEAWYKEIEDIGLANEQPFLYPCAYSRKRAQVLLAAVYRAAMVAVKLKETSLVSGHVIERE